MNISINIKSGTGGYDEYDGCDFCVKKIEYENFPIPRIGESIDIREDNDKKIANIKGEILKEYHEYLVTNVHYWIADNSYGVTIYVVPVGRNAYKE
jgi:hypothetical protein